MDTDGDDLEFDETSECIICYGKFPKCLVELKPCGHKNYCKAVSYTHLKITLILRDNGYMVSDAGILSSKNMGDDASMEIIPWNKVKKISRLAGKPYIVMRLWVTDDDIFNVVLKDIRDVEDIYNYLINARMAHFVSSK